MAHKYDNTVICSLSNEHCEKIVEWWNKELNSCYGILVKGKYIGLIDGWFNCYTLDQVQKANATIMELPDENLREQDWKTFTKDINLQDLIGRKVRGFKFKYETDGIYYSGIMDNYVGEVGVIVEIVESFTYVEFENDTWIYPTSLIHEHLVNVEEAQHHSFCEKPSENCIMNYCDENGCQERKRNLVDEPNCEQNVDTSDQNVDTSPQIIDLSNVEGVEMMVSNDEKIWYKEIVIAKYAGSFIDCNCGTWNYAKPIEVKKVTMKQVEEVFGCKVEIVKED